MSSVNANLGDGPQVLIPSRPPTSFTCEVALGECASPAACSIFATHGQRGVIHLSSCPGRPIRVSCSIRGKTWKESEVVDDSVERPFHPLMDDVTALRLCRDRWALVKALVLGRPAAQPGIPLPTASATIALFIQRDAVYAALYDMARAEEVLSDRANTILRLCSRKERLPSRDDDESSPSANLLRVYVGRIVEQVGILGVSP